MIDVEASPPRSIGGASPKMEWYICPSCKGEGIKIVADPRVPWKRHKELCSVCKGNRMVEFGVDSKEAQVLAPIRRCPLCRNFYAIGAGHPAEETNAPICVAGSHSHWHDMSFYPPPGFVDNKEIQPAPLSPDATSELQQLRQKLAQQDSELSTYHTQAEFSRKRRENLARAREIKQAKAAREKAAVPR